MTRSVRHGHSLGLHGFRRSVAAAWMILASALAGNEASAHEVARAKKPIVPVKVSVADMIAADPALPRAERSVIPRDISPAPKAIDIKPRRTAEPLVSFAQSESDLHNGASSRSVQPLVRSFRAEQDNGTVFPPDTNGAIGPNHAVSFLNSGFTVKNKFGGHVS